MGLEKIQSKKRYIGPRFDKSKPLQDIKNWECKSPTRKEITQSELL